MATRLTPDQFREQRVDQPGIVVDVRSPSEFGAGALIDVVTADFNAGEFEQVFPNWDKEATYYLYCRSGNRSGMASQILEMNGFKNVFNIGGYEELKAAGIE